MKKTPKMEQDAAQILIGWYLRGPECFKAATGQPGPNRWLASCAHECGFDVLELEGKVVLWRPERKPMMLTQGRDTVWKKKMKDAISDAVFAKLVKEIHPESTEAGKQQKSRRKGLGLSKWIDRDATLALLRNLAGEAAKSGRKKLKKLLDLNLREDFKA